jgi:dTDP-4-dehydrorhamnose 3,5-epimerase
MKLRPAQIEGSWLAEIEPIGDDRGFFARIWDEAEFAAVGVTIRNIQTNLSYNRHRGTIRGLHWQVQPYDETKLLRCTRGSVFDVAVDLRPDSPTFRQWQGVILSAEDRNQVLVPAGCAHGYQALEDHAEVSYQVSHAYVPGSERGIRWNDPSIGIEWPITEGVIVSPKDAAWPLLEPPPLEPPLKPLGVR